MSINDENNQVYQVLDFIKRRFNLDYKWTNGNCYYFAVILKSRFPQGTIYYDVIDGHFVLDINGTKYDWSGIASDNEKHKYIEWDSFDQYDELQKQSIIRDCIL